MYQSFQMFSACPDTPKTITIPDSMINFVRWILFTLFFSHTGISSFAQSTGSNYFAPITSPSPTTASLGKYGNLPVELSTGAASASIPLYDLNLRNNYAINFALSYSSNGVRIDDMAGNTGTDWSFIGEFAIRRTVLDDPDELSNDYTKLLDNGFNADSLYKLLRNGMGAGADMQPDLFTLVAPGYSARFYMSGDTAVFLNRNTPYRIKLLPGYFFRVTDGKGNVLLYGGWDAVEKTRVQPACPAEKEYYPTESYHPTAMFLRSIFTPAKDTIRFFYSDLSYVYTGNINITDVVEQRALSQSASCEADYIDKQVCQSQMIIESKKLDSLSTSNNAKIIFNYDSRKDNISDRLLTGMDIYRTIKGKSDQIKTVRLNYSYGTNKKRPFLSRVGIFSGDVKDSMIYALSYNNMNDLPDRLDDRVDFWGYYNGGASNGAVNPGVAGYGTLSRITYPTGGYNDIYYETNIVTAPVTTIIWNGGELLNGYGEDDHRCKEYKRVVTLYRSKNPLIEWSGQAGWEFPQPPDVNMHQMNVSIKDVETGFQYVAKRVQAGQVLPYERTSVIYGNRDSVKLELTMSACGQYVYGTFNVYWGIAISSYQDQPFAGLRTEKVISVDKFGESQVKKYLYAGGLPVASPEFIEEYYTLKYCHSATNPGSISGSLLMYYKLKHNKSLVDLFAYSNAPMYYSKVTEGYGENLEGGGIIHEFDPRLPISPSHVTQAYTTLQGNEFNAAPFSILRDPTVIERVASYFKKYGDSIKVISKEEYVYDWPEALFQKRNGYTFRQRVFNDWAQPSDYYMQFDVNTYYFNSVWFAKSKVITTVYANDDKELSNVTQYYYDNIPANNNVSRIEEINSKGDTAKVYFKYATNFKGQQVYDSMIARNMVDAVVDETHYLNKNITERDIATYGFTQGTDLIAPSLVQIQKGNNPLENWYRFHQYDGFGNILDRSKSNDAHEVYIWGYNNQYPVAKVMGSSYDVVKSFISQSIVDYPSTDTQLRDELNKIRTGLSGSKALVTTYTHLPLIGISSETDPAGRTIYYEYDTFGRLKLIKDKDGKILKQFDYEFQRPVTQ